MIHPGDETEESARESHIDQVMLTYIVIQTFSPTSPSIRLCGRNEATSDLKPKSSMTYVYSTTVRPERLWIPFVDGNGGQSIERGFRPLKLRNPFWFLQLHPPDLKHGIESKVLGSETPRLLD